MKRIISILIFAILAIGVTDHYASAKEKQTNETVVFVLEPAPVCQNCVNKIKGNLRFEKGVKDINVDLENKSVSITFQPKTTTIEKLSQALKKIGYTASTGTAQDTECTGNAKCGECK